MPSPSRTYLGLLLIGAFAFRLGTVLVFQDIHDGPSSDPALISNDDVQFNRLAVSLAEGNGYRITPDRPLTSFRAPGFPFALAGLYCVVGESPLAAYLFFSLLGAAACAFTYLLARDVLTENGARLAGIFAAVYLPHAYTACTFMSENLYVPLLALGLWLLCRFLVRPSYVTIALAGLTLGYATLTRPGTLLLLPPVVLVLFVNDVRQRRFRPLPLLLFSAVAIGVLLPWTIRNHEVHGKWVLVATNGGTTFWGANNDVVMSGQHRGFWVSNSELPHRDLILAAPSEIVRDEIEWKLGKDWVREHLASFPLLELYKMARLWWLPDYGVGKRWLRIVSYLPFLLLIAAAVVRMLWRKACWTPAWQILHASTLAVIATSLIFQGDPRFRDANMSVLMIYAVVGLWPGAVRSSEIAKSEKE